MKSSFLFSLIFVLGVGFSSSAFAKGKPWGVGGALGDPTGVTVKYRTNVKHSYQATLGWDIGDELGFCGDYLWDYRNWYKVDRFPMNAYWGIGIKLKNKDVADDEEKFRAGVRVPLGTNYYFRDPMIEMFGEVVPVLNLVEESEIELDFGLGVRFFF